MGKAKRNDDRSTKQRARNAKPLGRGIRRRQHSQNIKLSTSQRPNESKQAASKQSPARNQQGKPNVPFSRYDQVLLVGEGDFSFALSLATNHPVGSIVATSYDDEQLLSEKYPMVEKTLKELRSLCQRTSESRALGAEQTGEEWGGFASDGQPDAATSPDAVVDITSEVTIIHGIDATTLSKSHRKVLSFHSPFTKIVFNFPHTGGLSTDVNRQVRANQELLVGFFNSAKSLLASPAKPARKSRSKPVDSDTDFELSDDDQQEMATHLATGRILVTLFEGEPYTLWNIRDLARHSGLRVVESFHFPWSAYPGYTHARTVGDINSGKDRSDEGRRKGAWRGEERDARCYVLGLKEEVVSKGHMKKRKRGSDSEDSD